MDDAPRARLFKTVSIVGFLVLIGAGCAKLLPSASTGNISLPPSSGANKETSSIPVQKSQEENLPYAVSGCFRGSTEEGWMSSGIRERLSYIFSDDSDLQWLDSEVEKKLLPDWSIYEMCLTNSEISHGPWIAISLVHWRQSSTPYTTSTPAIVLPENAKRGTENVLGLFHHSAAGFNEAFWSSPVQLDGIVDTGNLFDMRIYENSNRDMIVQSRSGGGEQGFNWRATIDWNSKNNTWEVVSYDQGE